VENVILIIIRTKYWNHWKTKIRHH